MSTFPPPAHHTRILSTKSDSTDAAILVGDTGCWGDSAPLSCCSPHTHRYPSPGRGVKGRYLYAQIGRSRPQFTLLQRSKFGRTHGQLTPSSLNLVQPVLRRSDTSLPASHSTAPTHLLLRIPPRLPQDAHLACRRLLHKHITPHPCEGGHNLPAAHPLAFRHSIPVLPVRSCPT
jgi:hypothetical protein